MRKPAPCGSWWSFHLPCKCLPEKSLPVSLRVDHDGDFAVFLDGDGEVGSFVAGDEVAGGDGVSPLVFESVLDGNRRPKSAVALAIDQGGVVAVGDDGCVEMAVEVEVSHGYGLYVAMSGVEL